MTVDYELLPAPGCVTACVPVRKCEDVALSVWGMYKGLGKYRWVCA